MSTTNNKYVLDWVNEMADMTRPDKIVWVDGSDEQTEELRRIGIETGDII